MCIEAKCSTVFMDVSPVADGCFVTMFLQLCMFGGQWTWRAILDDTRKAHVESPPKGLPTVDDAIRDVLSRYARMDPSCATDLYRCEQPFLNQKNPFGRFTSFNDVNTTHVNVAATAAAAAAMVPVTSTVEPKPSLLKPREPQVESAPVVPPSSPSPMVDAFQAALSSLSTAAAATPGIDQAAADPNVVRGESLEEAIASILASSSSSITAAGEAAAARAAATADIIPGGIIDDIDESFTIIDGNTAYIPYHTI